jgi:glutamate N-acetyltransferase/amino-acid N-acetyltransferase
MNSKFLRVEGGVLAAKGYQAAGGTCGIKESGLPDVGILYAPEGALCFGTFTKNLLCAPPVTHSKSILDHSKFLRGVVVNSGNANACTGNEGLKNAIAMTDQIEGLTEQAEGSFLVCSTGKIGDQLPMDLIQKGIKEQHADLNSERAFGKDFSHSILTTDTDIKEIALEINLSVGTFSIGGCSKGAGMIHPDMATMLAFVTTDIQLGDAFREEYQEIINETFNSITVDGDTSTNDTALFFSNGASGLNYNTLPLGDQSLVREAIAYVFTYLAKAIVKDGEGATKFVEIKVTGANTKAEARKLGRFVANSKLVKTALFGGDPNWGRIVSAAATSGVNINPNVLSLSFSDIKVFENQQPLEVSLEDLNNLFVKEEIYVILDIGVGNAEASVWTCDLSYEYVKINAEYHT